MIPNLSRLPGLSKKLEKNAWADFIELLCLVSKDKEISLGDVLTIASREESEGPERGSEETGEQEDKLRRQFLDVFKYLENRVSLLGDFYPFSFVDEDTIAIDLDTLTLKGKMYLFLLYCSNLFCFTPSDRYILTHEFESLSRFVLKQMYPMFHVEVFGTASEEKDLFYGGTLLERFEKLAKCLNTELKVATKNNERYATGSGDGGLDLVGFMRIDPDGAETSFLPMCFAQCACSVEDWVTKQSSIKFDQWNQRFEELVHYSELIFVPFSLRDSNGKWTSSRVDQIVVIPIDRIRFLHILGATDMSPLEDTDASAIMEGSVSELDLE